LPYTPLFQSPAAPAPPDDPAPTVDVAGVLARSAALADTAAQVLQLSLELESASRAAAAQEAQQRAGRLSDREAAVASAQSAASAIAAEGELVPLPEDVRAPRDRDAAVGSSRVTSPGGGHARLRADAPRGVVALVQQWGNGAIPADALCRVPFAPGAVLQCDAAEALDRLNDAYRDHFGADLGVVSSYRTLESQVALRATKGGLAAVPGTSNHGWGLAVDLAGIGGLGEFDAPGYLWLQENAERFGWHHPRVMEPGGGGPQEPWHWEFGTA